MNGPLSEPRNEVITHLEVLNNQIKRQMSVWHVFRNGLIYGMGFILGSTVLTAIVVSVGIQFFGDTILGDVIAWIARTER